MTMPNDFKFDSRIRARMLRRGDLSAADLQAHVERLPDLHGEYEDMNEFTQPALVPARADACEPSPAFDQRRVGGISNAAASSSYLPSRTAAQAARPAPRPLSPLIPSPSAAERARTTPAFNGIDDARRAPPPVVTRVAPAAVDAAFGSDIPAPAVVERRTVEPGSENEPHTPVTLRSEQAVAKPGAVDDEDEDDDDDDDLDDDDDDDDDDDVDDLEGEGEGLESDDEDEDDDDDDDDEEPGGDDDEEPPTNPRGAQ
jgi:hypothetical protein